jgi:glycerophosphoryl diester phosphodiesterase
VLISAHDGFPRWVGCGADFLEIDIRRTKQGVFILSHDEPLPGAVSLMLDEVRSVTERLQLDLKDDPGFELELLSRFPADRVVVTTAEDESIKTVKDHFPTIRAGLTLAEDVDDSTRQRVKACGADFIALHHLYAKRFGEYGVPVWLWTVDDKRLLKRYLNDKRIEAIITNRPDIALRLRKDRS